MLCQAFFLKNLRYSPDSSKILPNSRLSSLEDLKNSVCPLRVVTLCTLCFLGSTLGIELGFECVEVIELGIYLHEERIKRRAVAVIPALINIYEIPVVIT